MQRIVIPTDFSDNAFNALKYAAELFKYEQCEFLLLHTYAEEIYDAKHEIEEQDLANAKESIHNKALKSLKEVEKKFNALSQNLKHSIKSVAAYGLLIDKLNALIKEENIDIVIMGTRGKTNDRKITFGSNTLQIIKYVQCPVLGIPEDFSFTGFSNILFPSNFMIPYQKRELKLIEELAVSHGAKLHLLFISQFPLTSIRQKENLDFLKSQVGGLKSHFHCIDAKEKVQAISEQIEKLTIDMLVMVNSRYTYLESIITESTIDKISLFPKVPFMVLQNYHRESN